MSTSAVATRPAERERDDLDLVAAARAGDDDAFALLWVRYQPRILAFVNARVRDHGRAEDITQDVFFSAARRMRQTEREIAFKPWIFQIAKNACIDASRRARAAIEVPFEAEEAPERADQVRLLERSTTPDAAVEDKVALRNLCGAFGGLSQEYHDILVLRELEGLSYREIGERLGMSGPAVESALFRARKRLSEEYEELASGERCRRVQRIIDARGGRAPGVRDQRRMTRHLAHCQPCRRYAHLTELPAAERSIAARIAAFLPLPTFLRRRWGGEDAVGVLGQQGGAAAQWSAHVASVLDPAAVSSWAKAVATAATVAVAGVGTGAAVTGSSPLEQFAESAKPFAHAPGLVVGGARSHALGRRSADLLGRAPTATLPAPAGAGAEPARGAPDAAQAPAPAATAQRGQRPASSANDPRTTAAPLANDEPAREQRSPSAATGADASGDAAGDDVGGRAGDTVGGAVSNTGAAGGGAPPSVPVSAESVGAGARPVSPVSGTAGTGAPAAQSTIGSIAPSAPVAPSAPAPQSVVGTVSSTPSDTLANTTPALTSLGR